MEVRTVTGALRDHNGDIVSLTNLGEHWSPRSSVEVIEDITAGAHRYVVSVPGQAVVEIEVVIRETGRYLRSERDRGDANNLDNLPEFALDYLPRFLGNGPDERRNDWSSELQGVAHSFDHWFFTQRRRILKFHHSADLTKDSDLAVTLAPIPPELVNLGCDHFGDPDYLMWRGHGYLLVPVEGENGEARSHPRLAVFEDLPDSIRFVGSTPLPAQSAVPPAKGHAGWCAIDPETLLLHSSFRYIDRNRPVYRYELDTSALLDDVVAIETKPPLRLHDAGTTLDIPQDMQGGCFSPAGDLYLSCSSDDSRLGGIYIFDRFGSFRFHSSTEDMPFLFEYHPGALRYEEPEGLTFWDLDILPSMNGSAPRGQLHAILLDNDVVNGDDFYLKHYRVRR